MDVRDRFQDLSLGRGGAHTSVRSDPSAMPYRAWQHGNDFVHVVIGRDEGAHTFAIHRDLLVRASVYFEKKLSSQPREPFPTITLPHLRSAAFEVVYQYVYTGGLHDDKFYDIEEELDMFWLRALHLAILFSLRGLASSIWDHFINNIFASRINFRPSSAFLHDLCTAIEPPRGIIQLQDFIIAKTAYTMTSVENAKWSTSKWERVFSQEPEFAVKVLQQASRLRGRDRGLFLQHPTKDPKFARYGVKAVTNDKRKESKHRGRARNVPSGSRSRSATEGRY